MTANTRLARALSADAPAKATPLELFALAKRQWLSGERVDVGAPSVCSIHHTKLNLILQNRKILISISKQ